MRLEGEDEYGSTVLSLYFYQELEQLEGLLLDSDFLEFRLTYFLNSLLRQGSWG